MINKKLIKETVKRILKEYHHANDDDNLQQKVIDTVNAIRDKKNSVLACGYLSKDWSEKDIFNFVVKKGENCTYDSARDVIFVGDALIEEINSMDGYRRLASLLFHEIGHRINFIKSGHSIKEISKDFEMPWFPSSISQEEDKKLLRYIYRFNTRELKARCFETTMFLKQSDPLPSLKELYADRCTDIDMMREFISMLETAAQEGESGQQAYLIDSIFIKLYENRMADKKDWFYKCKIVLNYFYKQFNWFKKRIDKIYCDFLQK